MASRWLGRVAKDQAAGESGHGRGDSEEDICRAIVVVHENPRGDERGSECSDAPTEIEECEERRASLRKCAAHKERDGRHGNADADAEQQKHRREQRARTGGDSEAGTDHRHETDGHDTRIVSAAKQRAQRSAGKVKQKQQAGIGIAEMKARGK